MNRFGVLALHRRVALWAALAVLLWGLSGLIHPVMTWTSPRPVHFVPPPSSPVETPKMSALKKALGEREIESMRLWPGLIWADGDVIDLKTGQSIPAIDERRAITLAQYYSGTEGDVKEATRITQFDDAYPYINRYLPAWRIRFADGRTVYVETFTDRIASITDDLKVALQTVFENVHTLKFLERFEILRVVLIASLVGSVPLMAVMGMFLQGAIRRRSSGARRIHRVLSIVIALPLFCFGVSGLFHLLMQSSLVYPQPPAVTMTKIADIHFMPRIGQSDDLRLIAGWWRAQKGIAITYTNVMTGATLEGDEAFARHLAAQWGARTIRSATLVTTFTPEYGFANKRLPVWRVEPETGQILFIEPRTATLAAGTTAAGRAETWTFANLHKWQFFQDRRILRDNLMILAVLLAICAVAAGLRLRRSKKAGF